MSKLTYYYLRLIETISRNLANKTSFLFFDKVFCKAKYRRILHKKLNLKKPLGFNAKIQWLKLYDRKPLYTQLADKYAVRDYVKERVGNQYLNKLFGVYDSVNDINFDSLPNKFILKATHGGGMNIICEEKEDLDMNLVKEKFDKWMQINFYHRKGEWQYKNIKPRIICEKFLEGDDNLVANDYKIYCFNGKPSYILVIADRFIQCKEAVFDTNWKKMPFHFDYPLTDKFIPEPAQFDLMLNLAKKLSSGIDFCRVDMYSCNGQVIIGELTLHTASGFEIFDPPEYDDKFGELLRISKRDK